ncbi:MAG TPA: Hsp20/alpha crystallin family protein [Spirochaetota bacterium]|nr:Hsp20/alpha crystallin family protein [Spirochaetota bacterium]HOM38789.1 Hsp20/alpha crystallin family protein [Spirochaetota bacterium]HPQ49847.1 Hsp20/alpha crystallin family protein [Spirochaetota bacterium]
MKNLLKRELKKPDLFETLRNRMQNIFEDFFTDFETTSIFKSDFKPLVDIHDDEKNVYIKAEIPGVKKEDIEVTIKDNVLTIKGEKKEEKEEKDKKKYVKECVYGSFERTFVVPEVDADKAKAEFKDGVLNITIPKKEEKKGKSISIE